MFVGGLPENATEEIIQEVFEQCGDITAIRKSKKNFCHIRFAEEFMVDKAIYLSGTLHYIRGFRGILLCFVMLIRACFPFAFTRNKVLTVWGWKRRTSAFTLGCQKLHVKTESPPPGRKGFPPPVLRNSIEFLINVLKCLLDEKQYYEY